MSPECWTTFCPKFYPAQQHPRVLLHILISRLFRLTIAYRTRCNTHLSGLTDSPQQGLKNEIHCTWLYIYGVCFVSSWLKEGDILKAPLYSTIFICLLHLIKFRVTWSWFRARWLSFGPLDWLPGTWLLHPRQTITQHAHPRSPFICAICSKFKLLDALDMSVNGKGMRQTFRNYFEMY